MNKLLTAVLLLGSALASPTSIAMEQTELFIGNWALTIPGGAAGWLGVTQKQGYLDASIMWGGGRDFPVASAYVDKGKLHVTRLREIKRKNDGGDVVRQHTFVETIIAEVHGDELKLIQQLPGVGGNGVTERTFSGKRIPSVPDGQDLSKVKYGAPIELINGRNIDNWELVGNWKYLSEPASVLFRPNVITLVNNGQFTNETPVSGWSVENGILVNKSKQEEGKPRIHYGNLRTVDEFEDFNLTLEVLLPKGSNSGIYLRGVYEVQVKDTYGLEPDSINMGAIHGRITPSSTEEKPAGEWQAMDITLCRRHVTVILNGTKIIDNKPLLGCTGAALWSDEFRPGPILLQGDHGEVSYRNIILKPIL